MVESGEMLQGVTIKEEEIFQSHLDEWLSEEEQEEITIKEEVIEDANVAKDDEVDKFEGQKEMEAATLFKMKETDTIQVNEDANENEIDEKSKGFEKIKEDKEEDEEVHSKKVQNTPDTSVINVARISDTKIILRRVTPKPPKNKCLVCDKVLCNANYLRKHIATIHHPSRPYIFKCNLCEKSFSEKSNLSKHLRTDHAGLKKPFGCPICGKAFWSNGKQLKEHLEIVHQRFRPFKCLSCGKRLHSKNELKRHFDSAHGVIRSYKDLWITRV